MIEIKDVDLDEYMQDAHNMVTDVNDSIFCCCLVSFSPPSFVMIMNLCVNIEIYAVIKYLHLRSSQFANLIYVIKYSLVDTQVVDIRN